jgi:hypothetical protein
LSPRQTALYIHTVDIYKPKELAFTTARDISSLTYPLTPTSAAVKCYRNTKPEVTQDSLIGRIHAAGTFVSLCEVSFESTVDINTNYVFKFTTDAHPDENEWFMVLGNPKIKNYKANKLTVYAVRSIKPKLK